MEFKQVEKGREGLFMAHDGEHSMGYMSYVWEGKDNDLFAIRHTVVEPKYEGKGVASALLNHAVDFARKNNKKIRAVCPFVSAKFSKSDAYDDVKV